MALITVSVVYGDSSKGCVSVAKFHDESIQRVILPNRKPLKNDKLLQVVKEHEGELQEWDEVRLCFIDEYRLGLIPNYRKCWGVKGVRVTAPYGVKYDWSWLWLSVDVAAGKLEALWTPYVRKCVTETFLDQLRQSYPNSFLIVVLDGAGWHSVDRIPKGMVLVPLPPYSPELNPVEIVNEALRGETANLYTEDLLEKEAIIERKLKEYWEDPDSLIQLTFYPWIRQQWVKIQEFLHEHCGN